MPRYFNCFLDTDKLCEKKLLKNAGSGQEHREDEGVSEACVSAMCEFHSNMGA